MPIAEKAAFAGTVPEMIYGGILLRPEIFTGFRGTGRADAELEDSLGTETTV